MNKITFVLSLLLLCAGSTSADATLDGLKRDIEALKRRVTALEEENANLKKQIDVDRLIVRAELIVSQQIKQHGLLNAGQANHQRQ